MPASGPGKVGDAVGDEQAIRTFAKARGIAIGIEDQSVALRRKARDHSVKEGCAPPMVRIGLSAAAHPPRQPARPAAQPGIFVVSGHPGLRPCVCAARIRPRHSRGSGRRRCAPHPTSAMKALCRGLRPIRVSPDLPRQIDAPGGETPSARPGMGIPIRTVLITIFRGQPPRGVENLVGGGRRRGDRSSPRFLSTALWRPTSSV